MSKKLIDQLIILASEWINKHDVLQHKLSDSAKQLAGIERHERRALGRLRRALQDFDAACVLEAIFKNNPRLSITGEREAPLAFYADSP